MSPTTHNPPTRLGFWKNHLVEGHGKIEELIRKD
jgi:hypothetical protein